MRLLQKTVHTERHACIFTHLFKPLWASRPTSHVLTWMRPALFDKADVRPSDKSFLLIRSFCVFLGVLLLNSQVKSLLLKWGLRWMQLREQITTEWPHCSYFWVISSSFFQLRFHILISCFMYVTCWNQDVLNFNSTLFHVKRTEVIFGIAKFTLE